MTQIITNLNQQRAQFYASNNNNSTNPYPSDYYPLYDYIIYSDVQISTDHGMKFTRTPNKEKSVGA